MTSVCVFVGPSLAPGEVRALCEPLGAAVSVLPPVQQGDLLRMLTDPPAVIGIVDGYFFQVPSVLHKEILLLIERGTRVLGGASLGALRAAELDTFGMEGVGTIYRWYREGTIDGDDEVAVAHGDARSGYQPLSEPMVNIRHNLRRARGRGVISARREAALVARAKALHFADRTTESLLVGPDAGRLRRFLAEDGADLKGDDTRALLQLIVDRCQGSQPWPEIARPAVHRTAPIARQLREYVGRTAAGHHVPYSVALSFEKLLSPAFPALYREVVGRHLPPGAPGEPLGPLLQAPALPWDAPLLDELERRGRLHGAVERAGRILAWASRFEARHPGHSLSRLEPERFHAWCARRWRVHPAALWDAARERGFHDQQELDHVARLACAYDGLRTDLFAPLAAYRLH